MNIFEKRKKKKKYKEVLEDLENLGDAFIFDYNGYPCSVCDFKDYYALSYNYETIHVDSIDDVKITKWFNGKSLNQLYTEVDFEYS